MRGRPPKPTELHKQQGTLNVTRHKARLETEPIPPTRIAEPAPEWMTESQKETWDYALEHAPSGLLKAIDRDILAIWVEAQDRWRRATILQARSEESVDFFMMDPHHIKIINQAALLMIKAGAELGFSPASRPRLAVSGDNTDALGAHQPPKNDLNAFLARNPDAIN